MDVMSILNSSTTQMSYTLFGIDELIVSQYDADIFIVKSHLTNDIVLGYLWWCAITIISLGNCLTMIKFWRQFFSTRMINTFQRKMLFLSSIYVVVCAIRGIWPRKDVDRICFFDRSISTVFVGRSLATIAELAFVKQLALLLGEIISKYNFGLKQSWFMRGYRYYVPFVAIAEVNSWVGVATKCQIFNAVEESIWMLIGLHMTISYVILFTSKTKPRPTAVDKRHFAAFIISGLLFVTFMCFIDIPMYVQRFYEDTYIKNVDYLWLSEGIVDLMTCKQVVHEFSIWYEDIPWMTGYFSICVWCSMYLINIPVVDAKLKRSKLPKKFM